MQVCFTPSMRIGTITLTLKKSPVDCRPAAGGPLLKDRNVRNYYREMNPKTLSCCLFVLCGSYDTEKMVLQSVDWISGSLKFSLVLEITFEPSEMGKCWISWLQTKHAAGFLGSKKNNNLVRTCALYLFHFTASLLQSVWCGPRWSSVSRWTPWNGGGLAGGVEGQSHGHTPCKFALTQRHRVTSHNVTTVTHEALRPMCL